MNAKEFIKEKVQNEWNGKVYLGFYEDEEIDVFDMMELYAESKAENLPISPVVGQSEQLVCDCGKPYHERDLEHGMCHQCWEPTKEAN
jgi:hypothetical protein